MKTPTTKPSRTPSPEILHRLSSNLKRLRKIRIYTQKRLEKMSGLSRNYISNVERETVNITLANLEALANGLGCTESDLLRREYE